jgi:hypothetical protein
MPNNSEYLKSSGKKNSMKLLPRMKQSFAIVKESNKPLYEPKRLNNNRILPIDIYNFNENTQFRNSVKFSESKEPSTLRVNK